MGTKRSGFTLVELLVVIGIIGILLAIVIPVYGRAKEKARQTQCGAYLHALGVAIRMYRDDWGAYPHVIARDLTAIPPDTTIKNDAGGIVSLYVTGDLDDSPALRCPDDSAVDPNDPYYTSYNSWNDPNSTHTDKIDQLYNWYGFDENGAGLETLQEASDTYAPGGVPLTDKLNRPLWAPSPPGLGTWTGAFPGLCNKNAPETTVITHCPHHRSFYRATVISDLVIRLGGNADLKKVRAFDWTREQDR